MTVMAINSADDLATLAKEAIGQVRISKQYRDLVGAILMANHVADWYFVNDLKRVVSLGDCERNAMKEAYPEWDVLRKLANGTKHCNWKLRHEQRELLWEDPDFWSSLGHVGNDGLDWYVEFNGEERSVATLIEEFLTKFTDPTTRPK